MVIANTSRSWGGTEHYAVQVAAGLARRGHAVRFLAGHPLVGERAAMVAAETTIGTGTDAAAAATGAATVPTAVTGAAFTVEECPLRRDGDLAGLARLVRVYREHRADAVLQTRWREYFLGGLAARMARVPLNVVNVGLFIEPPRDLKRRIVFKLADRIVVNAEEIRDGLAARSWIDQRKLRVVLNGVDLKRFRPFAWRCRGSGGPGGGGGTGDDSCAPGNGSAAETGDAMAGTVGMTANDAASAATMCAAARRFRAELGVPQEAPLVGTIGALSIQKEHGLLVRAAADVLARQPDAHFVIVGEGDLRPEIEAAIAESGLQERVRLPGFRADVRPVLAALDLFVLSSSNEGMAWVLLEALACGLPVVATDVSGTRACVSDGDNGRIVPVHDRAALAAAIADLLQDPKLRRRMGQRSRRVAEERFDAERMIDETETVLRGE